ncbi:hypothetical protein FRC00_007766 [Tulasnella sp. 408]|nr:hypothetical protein FRC00_007766 [Tulasnella sp. 408]
MKVLYFESSESNPNEEAPAVDWHLLSELHDNVISVKTEKFMETFMYSNQLFRIGIDQEMAKDCFTSLQSRHDHPKFNAVLEFMATECRIQRDQVLSSISTYSDGQFGGLVNNISREEELYHPLVTLFTYINSFFRFNLSGGTRGWDHQKVKTDPHQNPGSFLQRRFVVTNKKEGVFSSHIKDDPQPLPGLCLMLGPAPSASTNHTESGDSYWKNVKVPIGVTLKDQFDAETAYQMAHCARAIRVEQFDRNVVFTVLFSKRRCWVCHWNAASCHMAEFDVHENPLTFIQVIGRFASMSPASLGYDVRFSNAGRVLANEGIRTVLKVFPAPAKPFLGEVLASDDAADPIKVDLLVETPMFAARGLLFSRFTRVWEGREVRDETQWLTGPIRVVKQNWANAERISEAFLYYQAEDIPSVAKVLGSQVGEGTANHHREIAQHDVLGVYQIVVPAAQPSQDESDVIEEAFLFERREVTPSLNERVLVRMVFEKKGRSIFTGQIPIQVLSSKILA